MSLELQISISDVVIYPTSGELKITNLESQAIEDLVLTIPESAWFDFEVGQFENLDLLPSASKVLIVRFTSNERNNAVPVTATAYLEGVAAQTVTSVRAVLPD